MLKSFSKKVSGLNFCNLIKERLEHGCFPVIVRIAKFLRTPILRTSAKVCETCRMELFPKLIPTTEPNSNSSQASKVELFVIIVKD